MGSKQYYIVQNYKSNSESQTNLRMHQPSQSTVRICDIAFAPRGEKRSRKFSDLGVGRKCRCSSSPLLLTQSVLPPAAMRRCITDARALSVRCAEAAQPSRRKSARRI